MTERTNNVTKIGAILFMLWGLEQVLVGVFGFSAFAARGTIGILDHFAPLAGFAGFVNINAAAGLIALELSFTLLSFGVVAIWAGVLQWQGHRHAFLLNAVTLFIASMGFVITMLGPGYVSLSFGLIEPILYILGLVISAIGLFSIRAEMIEEIPAEEETRMPKAA